MVEICGKITFVHLGNGMWSRAAAVVRLRVRSVNFRDISQAVRVDPMRFV